MSRRESDEFEGGSFTRESSSELGPKKVGPQEANADPREPEFVFPGSDDLKEGLRLLLRSCSSTVEVVGRAPASMSTYPAEKVTCRLDGLREVKLFLKYSGGWGHDGYGHVRYRHRRGLEYEADVYRLFLSPYQASAPRFYGHYKSVEEPRFWLALGYLDEIVPVSWIPHPKSLNLAARWLGRFHSEWEWLPGRPEAGVLTRYDRKYYAGWSRRTRDFTQGMHDEYPWLPSLCEGFEDLLPLLLDAPQTLIHGEFYGKNVVVSNNTIQALDWESAAIAAGEIDLASITEKWDPSWVEDSLAEYQRARWQSGGPENFGKTFWAARLYLMFRWLGDRPSWTHHPNARRVFERLRLPGQKLDLI